MNVCLLFVCMTVLPIITGHGVFAFLYRKNTIKFHIADCIIVGWLVTIGLAEGAHLAAAFLGWQVSKVAILWLGCLLGVAFLGGLASLLFHSRNKKSSVKRRSKKGELSPFRFGLLLIFMLLLIGQIVTIVSYDSAYRVGDMTVETVESFLQTDRVYAVNPLTGREYTVGLPLRIRILGLPAFYSVLCHIFRISGTDLVWKYIPVLVLVLSYSAYWCMAGVLFEKEEERDKRYLFMVLVSLVFSVGDYACGIDGFNVLHCGYQGVVIRNLVLIPYVFALGLRRRWLPMVLAVLAEACITWTFYGLGATVLVAMGMAGLWLWRNRRTEHSWQIDTGLEESGEP